MTILGQARRPELSDSAGDSAGRPWPDAVTVISVYLVVLLAIPADRRVEALGGAGSPGALLAMLALLWWGWHQLHSRKPGGRRFQPVSSALLAFVVAVLISYAVSSTMSLPAAERSVADMGMLRLAAIAGIVLIAHDGVSSRSRFLVLMRRMSMFGGLYATLGLVQFFTGQTFVNSWSIPGLSAAGWISVGERAGFVRAISTAMHSLEAAVVLVMILPIALTVAIYDTKSSRFTRWYPVAAILFLSVLSVTRSALLGVAVVFLVLFWTWPKAVRRRMGAALAAGSVAVYVGVPGMAGTIIGMFSASDPSVSSRTDSYDTAAAFFQISPLFGRGLGMFLPSYRILDNQFLLTLVETGIVGLVCLICLIVAASWAALRLRRVWAIRDPAMMAFGYALFASVLAGTLLLFLFDAFSFPQACGIYFLIIGLCGAYLTMCREEAMSEHADGPPPAKPVGQVDVPEHTGAAGSGFRRGVLRRRWYPALASLVAMLGMSAAALATPALYYARVDVLFLLPDPTNDSNGLLGDPGQTLYLASIVERTFNDEYGGPDALTTFAPLYGTGLRYGHWVHIPSSGGQWETSYDRPLVTIEVVGESPDEVSRQLDLYAGRVADLARSSQELLDIPTPLQVKTSRSPEMPRVAWIGMKKSRAEAALMVLTIIAVTVAVRGGDRLLGQWPRRRRGSDADDLGPGQGVDDAPEIPPAIRSEP